ncbi:MAG: hypothetical protein ACRC20_02975 [Segniliparus sp.]|uniref:hypothetical protein n=1 Tax=Segniliparus sp. TaxID=2804064 RepID=UPI003F3F5DF5
MTAVTDLIGKLRDVEHRPQDIRSAANHAANHPLCPTRLKGLIRSAGDTAADGVQNLLDAVQPVLDSLDYYTEQQNHTPEAWDAMKASITKIISDFEDENFSIGGRWEGPAAEAYQRARDRQKAAVQKLKDISISASGSVGKSNDAWDTMCWGLVGVIAGVIVAVVAGLAAMATVVGAPAGAEAIIGTALAAVTVLLGLIAVFATASTSISAEARNIRDLFLTASEYPNGAWPIPATGSFGPTQGWTPK